MLLSCTAQKPADLKNTTRSTKEINPVCSNLNFEEDLLTKQNVQNLFECTGWDRTYPVLTKKINEMDTKNFNEVSKVFGKSLLSNKEKRKKLLSLVLKNEKNGNLKSFSKLLEKWITESNLMDSLNTIFSKLNFEKSESIFKLISKDSAKNEKIIQALHDISVQYDLYGEEIRNNLNPNELILIKSRLTVLLNDLTQNMTSKDWSYVEYLLYYENESPLRKWMDDGKTNDLNVLLETILAKSFISDVRFLKDSLITGITCSNMANTHSFNVDVAHELGFKIDGLVNHSKETFEDKLIHGFTKFVAFREFCEESQKKQGLEAFLNVIKYAMQVVDSDHDYSFLKTIHQLFGDDKFKILNFLSSNTFTELRDLLGNQKDDKFIRALYYFLGSVDSESFKDLAQILSGFSNANSDENLWLVSLSEVWKQLNEEEKVSVVSLLSPLFSGELSSADVFSILLDVFEEFPQLSSDLESSLTDSSFQKGLIYLVSELNDIEVQEDLGKLLSEDGLFQFVSIMAGNTEEVKKPQRLEYDKNPISYVLTSKSRAQRAEKICHAALYESYLNNPSYYSVVNNLPDSCMATISNVGFVGQIYVWMYESNKYFVSRYGVKDFHSGTGVWAPGMLQLIFTAAVGADQNLKNINNESGILKNINVIHKELTNTNILELIHQSSNLFLSVEDDLLVNQRVGKMLNSTRDEELKHLLDNVFKSLSPAKSKINVNASKVSCTDHSDLLGVNPCITTKELKKSLEQVVRIVKRQNRNENSLIKELISWIHPAGGIQLPNGRYSTSLKEMIGFLTDLSGDETKKDISYYSDQGVVQIKANTLERLEVVIRDISFLDNFYGAYFKNEVGTAEDYRTHVTKSEKLMIALERGSGLFRGVGSFPQETKTQLKNVRESYTSLIEVSDVYIQDDGTKASYGNFIQSLLAAIQQSSPRRTQSFNAYRNPNPKVVKGHNGVFLTEVVKISGLRHMSNFVKSRIDSKVLETPEFQSINKLVGRLDLKTLQNEIQVLLNSYFDADQNQLNLILSDMIDLVESLSDEEQKILEEIIVKTLVLVSADNFNLDNLKNFSAVANSLIKYWPSLREVFLEQKENRKDLMLFINKLLDRLTSSPSEVSAILDFVVQKNIFLASDLSVILSNPENLDYISKLLKAFSEVTKIEFNLNWFDVLRKMINSPEVKLDAFRGFMLEALSGESNKLSLSLLVSELGLKDESGYRFKFLMDELFINHQGKLETFLIETFPSLRLK